MIFQTILFVICFVVFLTGIVTLTRTIVEDDGVITLQVPDPGQYEQMPPRYGAFCQVGLKGQINLFSFTGNVSNRDVDPRELQACAEEALEITAGVLDWCAARGKANLSFEEFEVCREVQVNHDYAEEILLEAMDVPRGKAIST